MEVIREKGDFEKRRGPGRGCILQTSIGFHFYNKESCIELKFSV